MEGLAFHLSFHENCVNVSFDCSSHLKLQIGGHGQILEQLSNETHPEAV